MIRYVIRLVRRFREESFGQLAASLSFTTLISLVPLVTVAVIVGSALPFLGELVSRVDNFLITNFLPEKTGAVIARYAFQFSEKARRLTLAGIVLLAVTTFLSLSSIERAFNHLWRVRKPRPILKRIQLYAMILIAGPVLAGAILAVLTLAMTASLGLIADPSPSLRHVAVKSLAATLMCAFFSFLYRVVPNTTVRYRHAILGSVVATIGVMTLQKMFEIYITKFAMFAAIYGAFSALPIFLVWLYLCWAIVLIGALVVANFGSPRRSTD